MRKALRLTLAVALFAAIAASPCLVRAQILAGLALERLGVLSLPGTGARPLAMGGAYTAAGDDVFALLYNPAGLVEARSNEISISLHQRGDDVTNYYRPLSSAQPNTSTTLGHIAGVYPYPTYRGSLVLGFGVFQAGNSSLESIKNAYLPGIPATAENTYIQTGTLYQYCFGVGVDVSPSVSIGAGIAIWDESIEIGEEINYADADSQAFYRDDVSLDLDGVSFNVGLLVRFGEALRAGFSFTSPAWLSFDGVGTTRYTGDYTAGGGWTTDPLTGAIEEDYTLPMKWSGGLALTLPLLTVGADVSYADYSQTKYNGLTIRSEIDPGKRQVLEGVWSFRAGAEARLPMAPVSVRAGYAYVPLELSSVEEIAYIVDDSPLSVIADFETPRSRRFWSLGVGGVIDRVLSLDAAVVFGGYTKTTSGADGRTLFSETRDVVEFVVSGAYRF
jgi:long-subunit fatty acid transport protein